MQAKGKKVNVKRKVVSDTIIEQLDESSEKVAYTARVVETALQKLEVGGVSEPAKSRQQGKNVALSAAALMMPNNGKDVDERLNKMYNPHLVMQ